MQSVLAYSIRPEEKFTTGWLSVAGASCHLQIHDWFWVRASRTRSIGSKYGGREPRGRWRSSPTFPLTVTSLSPKAQESGSNLLPLVDGRLHQVAELFGCELIPFQVRYQFSLPIKHQSVKGMRE